MIDITSRDESGITVVEIEGKMNTGASPDAEKFLNRLLDEGATKILLNLEYLDFIASTGLRVILATGKKLAGVSGKLVICSANLTVMDVLKMSGFNQMFNVFDSEEEALASF
ncbi:MAG TPA: STAS domain-containing protein [Anaerolineales bacterium]|jgi:anti-anti-sigma factor|nr:STAS domain-containing protein [Anaerolineales bacterium]